MKRARGLIMISLGLGANLALAGSEFELEITMLPKASKLSVKEEVDRQIQVGLKRKQFAASEVPAMRTRFEGEEKQARTLASAKGKLEISAGDWGSEVIYPVINLTASSTSPFYERFDGTSTATASTFNPLWQIDAFDRRGLAGRFLDMYLLTGYLDPLTHRVESSRTTDGRWKDVYERRLKDIRATGPDQRFTLIWSDAGRSKLLYAFDETTPGPLIDFWRKGTEYRILRQSSDRKTRLFDEAIASRLVASRPRTNRYKFKRETEDPVSPYGLLHDVEPGTLITETGADGKETVTYSYEGYRVDPHQKAILRRRGIAIGVFGLGSMALVGLGLIVARARRHSPSSLR